MKSFLDELGHRISFKININLDKYITNNKTKLDNIISGVYKFNLKTVVKFFIGKTPRNFKIGQDEHFTSFRKRKSQKDKHRQKIIQNTQQPKVVKNLLYPQVLNFSSHPFVISFYITVLYFSGPTYLRGLFHSLSNFHITFDKPTHELLIFHFRAVAANFYLYLRQAHTYRVTRRKTISILFEKSYLKCGMTIILVS